jgi:hypothetical protein
MAKPEIGGSTSITQLPVENSIFTSSSGAGGIIVNVDFHPQASVTGARCAPCLQRRWTHGFKSSIYRFAFKIGRAGRLHRMRKQCALHPAGSRFKWQTHRVSSVRMRGVSSKILSQRLLGSERQRGIGS